MKREKIIAKKPIIHVFLGQTLIFSKPNYGCYYNIIPTKMSADSALSRAEERKLLAEKQLELAKVNGEKMVGAIQSLEFGDPVVSDELKLIELDNELAEELTIGKRSAKIFTY